MAKGLTEKSKQIKSPAQKSDPDHRQEVSLLQLSTVVYSVMASIGILIAMYGHQNFTEIIALPADQQAAIKLLSIGSLAVGVLLIFGLLFEEWFPSFKAVKEMVTNHLGTYSFISAFYLAAMSAVGEEFLFRAAIQPFTGVIIASIFFALLHIGPDGRLSTWSLWALLAGLLLGWIFETTGSILVPIGAHFSVNFISILRVQHHYRSRSDSGAPTTKGPKSKSND